MLDQSLSGEAIRETAFRNMVQIGVVVKDLDRTIEFLTDVLGLGPFRYITYPPDRDDMKTTYRGEPGAYSHRIAFTDLGPIEFEIAQPLTGGEKPVALRRSLETDDLGGNLGQCEAMCITHHRDHEAPFGSHRHTQVHTTVEADSLFGPACIELRRPLQRAASQCG